MNLSQPSESEQPEAVPSGHEHLPIVPKERYDLQILKSLRRILRSVDVYSSKLAQEHGVTVPQLICLLKVDELGSLTLKELSAEVYLSPSTLVGIIDRLERQDLLRRQRSVRDRRKVRIDLTDKGRQLIADSPSPLQDSLACAIKRLPELERATIALSLAKVAELMESHPAADVTDDPAPILESEADLRAGREIPPSTNL